MKQNLCIFFFVIGRVQCISVICSGYICIFAFFSGCHLQCIYGCFCSFLSSSTTIWWSDKSCWCFGGPICHVLQWILWNTMIWEDSCQKCLGGIHGMFVKETWYGLKVSALWWGTLPLSNCLEICLLNGSVFCICSKISLWSSVRGGCAFTLVVSCCDGDGSRGCSVCWCFCFSAGMSGRSIWCRFNNHVDEDAGSYWSVKNFD